MEKKRYILAVATMLWVTSCSSGIELHEDFDRGLGLTRDEIVDKLLPPSKHDQDESETAAIEESPIPDVSEILLPPSAIDESEEKLISLSVTEDVPLKDVLVEISRLAGIDMEIDANITGGVIFRVANKPYMEVIDRISDLGGLRYEMVDGILRVQRDAPYIKNYAVDFLNLVRSNSGGVSISTQVLSSSGGDGGLSSGSTNEITSSYDGDIWAAIETGMAAIMQYQPKSMAVLLDEEGNSSSVDAVDGVSSYSINKQAGVITALATEKQHKSIQDFISKTRRQATAQVLIEAKIVEVTLDEEFRNGINWGAAGSDITDYLLASKSGVAGIADFTNSLNRSDGSVAESATISLLRGDKTTLKAAVQLMESFGTSRTLSSPRLNATHNQQAVLTFAENEVYFTVEVSTETETLEGGEEQITVLADSTLNTVPIGIILTLQPSINLDEREVTMNIRPTLSRITEFVEDPGVSLQVAQIPDAPNVSSNIPVIEVRELDSMVKLQDGQILVMGGLMEERTSSQETGLPYVSRLPMFGHLFKGSAKTTEVVETVIFLKATIVESQPPIHDADKKLYENFTRDPRPLAF